LKTRDLFENHDYDPNWDYEVAEVAHEREEIIQEVEQAIAQVRTEVLPELGFQDMHVFFVEEDGLDGALGVYASGTSSLPNIGLDLWAIDRGAEKYQVNRANQILGTIVHELGHAYQDSINIDFHHQEGIEDEAEEFARNYITWGIVDKSVLET